MFIAHIRKIDHEIQSVQEHLEGVATLARRYGDPVGLGAHAELAGLLHDMGKYTLAFTEYIKNAVIHEEISRKKIDHSTAGAKYLYENYYKDNPYQKIVVETVGMAILSHHSGLQNFVQLDLSESDFVRRVTNVDLPYYEEVVENFERIKDVKERIENLIIECITELKLFMQKVGKIRSLKERNIYLSYMQKLVFSCLIDADRTDTRRFEENDNTSNCTNNKEIFITAYNNLMDQVTKWEKSKQPINILRNKMSESCDKRAEDPTSILTLSIPTGGGKTLSSLRFALKHAIEHKKERIFYIIPYTTIIEQNAESVRMVTKLKDKVLEHHSNVIGDKYLDDEPDYYQIEHHKQLQLARDNWDYPIIFTTIVQFLDVFFQKGTRKCRRLHHLTNSVIIFDEVQAVPFKHFHLFNTAVNFLNIVGNSSVLLCTATQPAVEDMDYKIHLLPNPEIVPELSKTVEAFKRVSIINNVEPGGWKLNQIANFAKRIMEDIKSLLIILNTKSEVRKLYKLLKEQTDVAIFHLSTSMCPAHRREKLSKIQSKLGKERIICVSTQLIEAGVDISFESVIRSLAGLDSIAQAAGRCNRNGELKEGKVYIIKSAEENLSMLPEIKIGGEVTNNYILNNRNLLEDYLSPKAIYTYFRYFNSEAKRDINRTHPKLNHEFIQLLDGVTHQNTKRVKTYSKGMFKTVEKYFQAIDSPTTSVIVPYKEGKEIIAFLNEDLDISKFNEVMKKAQQYSVNLFDFELQTLSRENLLVPIYDNSIYCLNEKAYDLDYGVTIDGEAPLQTQII